MGPAVTLCGVLFVRQGAAVRPAAGLAVAVRWNGTRLSLGLLYYLELGRTAPAVVFSHIYRMRGR